MFASKYKIARRKGTGKHAFRNKADVSDTRESRTIGSTSRSQSMESGVKEQAHVAADGVFHDMEAA